jgi:hypothetical protein
MQDHKMMKRSAWVTGMSAGALLALAACGSADGEGKSVSSLPAVMDDESQFPLLAEVGLPGRTVKFFEPEEGTMLEIEVGELAKVKPTAEEQSLTGSALYEHLTQSSAPQALLEAEKRATLKASTAKLDVEPTLAPDEPVQSRGVQKTSWIENAKTPGNFYTRFCTPTDRFWDGSGLPYSNFTKSGINMAQAGVSVTWEGEVDYHASYSSNFNWTKHISGGWYIGWRQTSSVSRTVTSEVSPYSGTNYNHCVNYHF